MHNSVFDRKTNSDALHKPGLCGRMEGGKQVLKQSNKMPNLKAATNHLRDKGNCSHQIF